MVAATRLLSRKYAMPRWLFATLLVFATTLPARAAELSVFAAASLTEVTRALAGGFETAHPGTTVAITKAASGALLRRMETGETADVLLSADTNTMDAAVAKGRVVPDSLTPFAGNELVMAVPAGNPAGVTDLDDLTRGGVRRVGVGNPESVPAGRYAKRALQERPCGSP
jgi:molybdate transport system substrate-binding protein